MEREKLYEHIEKKCLSTRLNYIHKIEDKKNELHKLNEEVEIKVEKIHEDIQKQELEMKMKLAEREFK